MTTGIKIKRNARTARPQNLLVFAVLSLIIYLFIFVFDLIISSPLAKWRWCSANTSIGGGTRRFSNPSRPIASSALCFYPPEFSFYSISLLLSQLCCFESLLSRAGQTKPHNSDSSRAWYMSRRAHQTDKATDRKRVMETKSED